MSKLSKYTSEILHQTRHSHSTHEKRKRHFDSFLTMHRNRLKLLIVNIVKDVNRSLPVKYSIVSGAMKRDFEDRTGGNRWPDFTISLVKKAWFRKPEYIATVSIQLAIWDCNNRYSLSTDENLLRISVEGDLMSSKLFVADAAGEWVHVSTLTEEKSTLGECIAKWAVEQVFYHSKRS